MCWSQRASAISAIQAYTVVAYLLYVGKPKEAIFLATYALIQVAEVVLWGAYNSGNRRLNLFMSKIIIPTILGLEFVASAVLNPVFLTPMWMASMGALYIYMFVWAELGGLTTVVQENVGRSLMWTGRPIPWYVAVWFYYLLIRPWSAANLTLVEWSMQPTVLVFGVITAVLFMTQKSFGSRWCFVAALFAGYAVLRT